MNVLYLTAKNLSDITHGFFTRQGGMSSSPFDTLNMGLRKQDPHENVFENRRLALESLGVAEATLQVARQVHGNHVIVVEEPWEAMESPEGDALVTNQKGIALGIITADCVPVLFVDSKNNIIGAAHAGWRGALMGIVHMTLSKMISLGADIINVKAALGPSIAQENYEVGQEVYEAFIEEQEKNAFYFKPSVRESHFLLDLNSYVAAQLQEAGVGSFERIDEDTYALEEKYFSYRRSTHQGQEKFGCQLSAIALGGK